MFKKQPVFILILLLIGGIRATAQEASSELILDTEVFNANINTYMQYYLDKDNIQTVGSIESSKIEFKPLETDSLALTDVSLQTIWSKIKINSNKSQNKKYYLKFFPPYLGHVELYRKNKQGYQLVSKTGSLITQNFEDLSADLALPFVVSHQSNDYLIKVHSVGAGLSVKMQDEATFNRTKAINEIIFSFIIGALMMLALYHIFIFFTSKETIYFYYVSYTLSMIAFQFGMTGFNRYILPPKILGFHFGYLGSLLAGNLLVASISIFTYHLFELKNRSWKFRYPLIGLALLAGMSSLYLLATESAVNIIFTRVLGLLMIVTTISVASVLSFQKNSTARFYLLSWGPILAGTIVLILTLNGVIEESPVTRWILPFGTIIESLLLAFAIGNRLQKVTKEKMEEQKLKLQAFDQLKENFDKMKARDNIIRTYVSPTILTEVALGKSPIEYPPQHISRTILFTDLRNYTSLTERISSEKAYKYLNQYFTTLNKSIFNHNGEVDKLIGDAIMATFNNPNNSIKAYSEFRAKFNSINKARIKKGVRPIFFGTGVAFGEVLSANFGSSHKLDRTIVGDAVNIASRCESLTKKYGVNLIATPEFISQLDSTEFIRPLDLSYIKGKKGSHLVYEVFSDNPNQVIEYKLKTKKLFEEQIELRSRGLWTEAIKVVDGLIKDCPRHTYINNKIMDMSLLEIKKSIQKEIEQKSQVKDGKAA